MANFILGGLSTPVSGWLRLWRVGDADMVPDIQMFVDFVYWHGTCCVMLMFVGRDCFD